MSDRAALAGIVSVLKSGNPWEMLPKEMGCGSGSTCWVSRLASHPGETPSPVGGVVALRLEPEGR